jgi:hypothetical protein
MKAILLRLCVGPVLLLVITLTYTNAQSSTDKENVTETIMRLFSGMKAGDSAMVHSAFAKDVTLATVYHNKSGKPVLEKESAIREFLITVGTPHAEVWYEEIWGLQIQIDDNFAQAWCDYAFYLDKRFSHCGVDAFHLFKDNNGWKIFHLADTRRKEPCDIPDTIKSKHK